MIINSTSTTSIRYIALVNACVNTWEGASYYHHYQLLLMEIFNVCVCVCVCPKKWKKKMIMNVLFVCLFFRNCLLLMLRKERERNGTGIEGIPGKGWGRGWGRREEPVPGNRTPPPPHMKPSFNLKLKLKFKWFEMFLWVRHAGKFALCIEMNTKPIAIHPPLEKSIHSEMNWPAAAAAAAHLFLFLRDQI